jgi:hypothetical protein
MKPLRISKYGNPYNRRKKVHVIAPRIIGLNVLISGIDAASGVQSRDNHDFENHDLI